jgi:cobalt transporter subunit CbtA
MINRMVTSALFAGFAAGLFAALLHFAFVQPKILLGEEYESGAAVHFAGAATADHDHDEPAVADVAGTAEPVAATDAGHDHDAHDHADGDETSPLQRNALTVLFFALEYCGYALILVAGFAFADLWGKRVTALEGLLWGVAGFVAVKLAPAMGLAPELPGTLAAPLLDRQIWWGATVLCSGVALAMIGYGRTLLWVAVAAVLLALPHIIGAPELETFTGVAPPEVAASFAIRSLGLGFAAWALMGWLAGWFWDGKQV